METFLLVLLGICLKAAGWTCVGDNSYKTVPRDNTFEAKAEASILGPAELFNVDCSSGTGVLSCQLIPVKVSTYTATLPVAETVVSLRQVKQVVVQNK